MTRLEELVLRTLAIVLVPVVAGLSIYVTTLWRDYSDSDVWENGYIAPKYLYKLIEDTSDATVTIECKDSEASGFGFMFEEADEAQFTFDWPDWEKTSIVLTNYHVVEDCYQEDLEVFVRDSNSERIKASIKRVDVENDIAALWIPKRIPELYAAPYFFRPGYWVMATGSPYGMQGTTTFGNIINLEGNRIYTSASLNRGNSGGPLVDNTGYVMAINTGYRAVAQNLNYAIDINALCVKLAACYGDSKLIHPNKDEG